MANRVTSDEVKEIIDTSLTVDAFITAANLIVTNHLTDSDLGTSTLKEIERWISSHLVAINDPKIKSETIGKAKQDFSIGPLGKGLEFTSWGQQALLLDTSGILRGVGKTRAKIEAINFSDYSPSD